MTALCIHSISLYCPTMIYTVYLCDDYELLFLVEWFLPLDEVIASRAVFVIVFVSDGRKRFWSQLNNSKTVSDRSHVSMGELIGIYGRATE